MAEFFIGLVIGLAAIQLLLLVYLVLWKKRTLGTENRKAAMLEELKPDFLTYLEGGEEEPAMPENEKLRTAVLEGLLSELVADQKDERFRGKISSTAERHLAAVYKKRLTAGTWAERVNALYFIEDFRIHSLRRLVFSRLEQLPADDEECRQSLRVCTALQEPDVIGFLISRQESFSTGLLKELLRRFDEPLLHEVKRRLEADDGETENLMLAFLTTCGEQQSAPFFLFVEGKLADRRKEVRLKALRSLVSYGRLSDPALIAPFFSSEHWEERMYAAKITGACGLGGYRDALLSLFSDPVWWVRFSAADNALKFETGPALLTRIAEQHEDPFARDIARHMVTRKGGDSVA
ncbi:HEAT repeat domain-containing protein [Indiicoccus explosivorum]|uniref:HEAT repeat domain-containing protein n=1 Tax=Indiicoccus explosivorum TaxID=1917864 RepID=UPI000B4469F3|nr:hypothetical protein [Indiicoccus explosivorum]